MKNYNTSLKGFTLIEVLVSMTIFSIIMVSVITIFIFSSNLSAKVDINRAMQENIKNAVETIAEDVRVNGIEGITDSALSNCSESGEDAYKAGNKLCIQGSSDSYRLKRNLDDSKDIATMGYVSDMTKCSSIKSHCVLFKGDSPLTNSSVSFRKLRFDLSGGDGKKQAKKVTISFTMQPATQRGIRSDLIKNSKIVFQTTLSERLIRTSN